MALINHKRKEVQIKIIYYGPGRAGKTHNLQYLYDNVAKRFKTEFISIKTKDDHTLFFDFFPINVGQILGYKIKTNLYTIPGQAKYNSSRKLLLTGADGIVFVADSLAVAQKKNINSLKNLKENLKSFNRSIFKVPVVIQYNKRDLAERGLPLLSIETLEKDLNNELKAPSFAASALTGVNVMQTAKKIITLASISVKKHLENREALIIDLSERKKGIPDGSDLKKCVITKNKVIA